MNVIWVYAKSVLKSAATRFFAAVDVGLIMLDMLGYTPDLSPATYALLGGLAVFLGGLEVHRADQREILSLQDRISEMTRNRRDAPAEIDIELLAGRSYTFTLFNEQGHAPRALFGMNLRIKNSGGVPVQLLGVTGTPSGGAVDHGNPMSEPRWQITFSDERPLDEDGKPLKEMVPLKPGDHVNVTLRGEAGPAGGLTPYQYAARLGQERANHDPGKVLWVECSVEFVDGIRNELKYDGNIFAVESTQLDDAYRHLWKTLPECEKLLELAAPSDL